MKEVQPEGGGRVEVRPIKIELGMDFIARLIRSIHGGAQTNGDRMSTPRTL